MLNIGLKNTLRGGMGGAAVAVPWYLAGGVSAANCLAAYQPKGAADYAASLMDLTGNSNSATEGTTPDWDITNGWSFDASNSEYLIVPLSASGIGWSLIARYKDFVTGAAGYILGSVNLARHFATGFRYNGNSYFGAGNLVYVNISGASTGGVLCVAGEYGYYNGVEKTSSLTGATDNSANIFIGCLNSGGSPANFATCKIQALAIYNTTLTADQVAAISTAMAAL